MSETSDRRKIDRIDEPGSRRKSERIILRGYPRVTLDFDGSKKFEVELLDVSNEGCNVCLSDLSSWPKDLPEQMAVDARLCFSDDTFISLSFTIVNTRTFVENGRKLLNIGCAVDPKSPAFPVYEKFIAFLNLYSEYAHREVGDVDVEYL